MKRYIIVFTGIFQAGSVKLVWFQKSSESSIHNYREHATKFRYRFIAELWCKHFNRIDDKLRAFKVMEININKTK